MSPYIILQGIETIPVGLTSGPVGLTNAWDAQQMVGPRPRNMNQAKPPFFSGKNGKVRFSVRVLRC